MPVLSSIPEGYEEIGLTGIQSGIPEGYEEIGYDTSAPVKPDEKPGALSTIGRGLTHGAIGLAESVGTGLQWAGERMGDKPIAKAGETASKYWGKIAEPFGPPESIAGKNVIDDPSLLADATYWLYNVPEMIPALGATILSSVAMPQITVAKNAPKIIASLAKLSKLFPAFVVGGGLEATQTYKGVLSAGGSEESAARSAELMFLGAGALNAIGTGKILEAAGAGFKGRIIKILGAGAWEGITEGLEEPTEVFSKYIGKYLAGEELPADLKEQLLESLKAAATVAPIAAVTGFGASVLGGTKAEPTDENVETFRKAVESGEFEKGIISGDITPDMVEDIAINIEGIDPSLADTIRNLSSEKPDVAKPSKFEGVEIPEDYEEVIAEPSKLVTDNQRRIDAIAPEYLNPPEPRELPAGFVKTPGGEIVQKGFYDEIIKGKVPPLTSKQEGLLKKIAEEKSQEAARQLVKERPDLFNTEMFAPEIEEHLALPPGQGFELKPTTKLRKPPVAKPYEAEVTYKPIVSKSGKPFRSMAWANRVLKSKGLSPTEYTIIEHEGGYAIQRFGRKIKPAPTPEKTEVALEEVGVKEITPEQIAKELGITYKDEVEGLYYFDLDVERGKTTFSTKTLDLEEIRKIVEDKKEAFAVEKVEKEAVSDIDNLIESFEATGHVATRYPRKRQISVDGRTMNEKEAIEKMRRVVEARPSKPKKEAAPEAATEPIKGEAIPELGLKPEPLEDSKKNDIINEFEQGRAEISLESTCVDCKGKGQFVDEQMEKAVSLSKKSEPVKKLTEIGEIDKEWIADATFYINEDYVVGIHSGTEHFFKFESPFLEKSDTSIDVLREAGRETIEAIPEAKPKLEKEKVEAERFLYEQKLDDISIRMLENAKRKLDIDYGKTIETARKIAKLEKEKLSQEHIAEAIQYAVRDYAIVEEVTKSKKEIVDGREVRILPNGQELDEYVAQRVEQVFDIKKPPKEIPEKPSKAKYTEDQRKVFAQYEGKIRVAKKAKDIKEADVLFDKGATDLVARFNIRGPETTGEEGYYMRLPVQKKFTNYDKKEHLKYSEEVINLYEKYKKRHGGTESGVSITSGKTKQQDGRLPAEVRDEKAFATKAIKPQDTITRKDLRKIFSRMKHIRTGQDSDGNLWFKAEGRPKITIFELDNITGHLNTSVGRIPVGSYLRNTIELKTRGKGYTADISTAYHELYHWLEKQQILSANDITALNGAIAKAESISESDVTEEHRAYYVGDNISAWETQKHPRIRRILRKLTDFMNAIYDFAAQAGWVKGRERTAESVLSDIESGKLLKKPRVSASEIGQLVPAFQQTAPYWYSQVIKAVEQKFPAKMNARSIANWIQKQGGKPVELEWIGLDEWLEGKKVVTKDELSEFLRANQVEVREVEKGSDEVAVEELADEFFEKKIDEVVDEHLEETGEELDRADVGNQLDYQRFVDEAREGLEEDTKFGKWQLPGGENYKELLLTLPVQITDEGFAKWYQDKNTKVPFEKLTDESQKDMLKWYSKETGKEYKSPHYDEPDILAHVRFNERTDADGSKVLFLEEVQSDWALEGRKEGYKLSEKDFRIEKKTVKETPKELMQSDDLDEHIKIVREFYTDEKVNKGSSIWVGYKRGIPFTIHYSHRVGVEKRIKREIQKDGGVPDMPFKENWYQVALKRMLRYASENGFDKLAWVTGEQTADRYDLSKKIDSVKYFRNKNGTYNIFAEKDGKEVIATNQISESKVQDYTGKELAEKIISNTKDEDSYSGLDLKIEAAWAKHLYDKMIPQYLKKFGKKWGAKVGEINLEAQGIKAKDLSDGYSIGADGNIYKDYEVVSPKDVPQHIRAAYEDVIGVDIIKVQAITITPEMKQSAMREGMPLFQMAGKKATPEIKIIGEDKSILNRISLEVSNFLKTMSAMDVYIVPRTMGKYGYVGRGMQDRPQDIHIGPKALKDDAELNATIFHEALHQIESGRWKTPAAMAMKAEWESFDWKSKSPKELRELGFGDTLWLFRKTKVKALKSGEFFAEMGEYYLERPKILKKQAKPIFDFFEKHMVEETKQFATKPTKDYRAMLRRYQEAHTTPLVDEAVDKTKIKHFDNLEKTSSQPDWIKDKFGREEKTLKEKIGDNVGAFRKNWQTRLLDRLHPIKALGETAYMLHRLETGAQATMAMFMRHGKLRWEGKALIIDTQKQGFMPWLDSLGDDAQKLFYWMAAKRAEVLETEGREKWLDTDTRKKIFDWVGEKPKSEKSWRILNSQFQGFNKSVLDLAQQSGLINPIKRAAWEQEFYVPFYRIFEDAAAREEFLKGPLMGKKHISAQIKRLLGAEMKIGDPLENVIRNWSHLIHESVRNMARAEAYDYAQKNKMKSGMTDESGKLMPLIETVKASELNIYRSDKEKRMVYVTKKGDDNILSFQKDGRRVYFKVNDAEMFNALSDVNHRQFNGFLIRAFGQAKRWLTYGATFGPAFKVANMLRDSLHTAIISKSFIPFIDSGKGIVKALREDADYVKFMASGAGFGSSYIRAENPQALAEYINRIVKKEGESAAQRVLDTPKKMLDFWEKLGAASENAARVQLYTKRISEGESHLKAAFEGRDLMDFTMRGDSQIVQFLIRTVPFMNARAQGLYKLGRTAKQDPKSFAVKGAMLTMATLALWAINRDEDEWKGLEDWDKRTYYHFWIGDKHYRIPKPFETGAIFSTVFEGMAEVMSGDEEFGYFVDVMKDTFLDTFAMNPIPQAVRPLIEQWSNKSFFTGRPIEGQSLQRLRTGERKTAWTSETMQLAGKLGVSPKRAEEIIRGYFSTFGMFLLGISDIFSYHLADFPTNPTKEIDDYPLLGRFIKERAPARHTKYQTEFYEIFREVDQLVATVNNYKKLGNYKEAVALSKKKRKNLIKKKGLFAVRKQLTEINAKLRRIMSSRILTAEQKRARVNQLIERKNRITKRAYEIYAGD